LKDIQVGLGSADKGGKFTLVLALDLLDSKNSGSLLVDYCAETSLALNNDVGDTHLAAESGKEDDELNRVNIVGNDDEGGLLGFNESNNVVKTVLDEQRLLGVLEIWKN